MNEQSTAYKPVSDSLQRLKYLSYWLDNRFTLPGTKIAFGFDSLIGLVPGVGDIATGLLALYIFLQAIRHRCSVPTLMAMLCNIVVDEVLGAIPVAGDVFDVFYRVNKKNVDMILQEVEGKAERAKRVKLTN